jgi:hypothetical protein
LANLTKPNKPRLNLLSCSLLWARDTLTEAAVAVLQALIQHWK